jgi:hypothetical protein
MNTQSSQVSVWHGKSAPRKMGGSVKNKGSEHIIVFRPLKVRTTLFPYLQLHFPRKTGEKRASRWQPSG